MVTFISGGGYDIVLTKPYAEQSPAMLRLIAATGLAPNQGEAIVTVELLPESAEQALDESTEA